MSADDKLKRFEQHARRAADEAPPEVHVADAVMARLPEGGDTTPPLTTDTGAGVLDRWQLDPGLLAAASFAAVAAVAASVLAAPWLQRLGDPLIALFDVPGGWTP